MNDIRIDGTGTIRRENGLVKVDGVGRCKGIYGPSRCMSTGYSAAGVVFMPTAGLRWCRPPWASQAGWIGIDGMLGLKIPLHEAGI